MNQDKLDALIRAGDPAMDHSVSNADDPLLGDCHRQWTRLAGRRRIVRKRVSLCLAVIGLFAVVGGSTLWMMQGVEQGDHPVAKVSAITAKPERLFPDKVAIADLAQITSNQPRKQTIEPKGADSPRKAVDANQSPESLNPTNRDIQRRRIRSADRIDDATSQLAEFAMFVDRAGKRDSESWRKSRDFLARQNAETQRAAVNLVPQLTEPTRRTVAMDLVCDAAGDSRRTVLKHWLNDRQVAPVAWERLINGASFEQSIELVEIATTEIRRTQVCQRIVASADSRSIDVLLTLTADPNWRTAVGRAAARLHPNQIQSLIMLMRQRSVPMRTAVAFMLASVPGDHVDRNVASMILRGRYRQPAYLVLLSRDTPQARAFLAQASSDPELTPALVSARMHFANIQQRLYQWIAESKGTHHERFDNTQSLVPEMHRGDRPVRRNDNHRQYS